MKAHGGGLYETAGSDGRHLGRLIVGHHGDLTENLG